MKEELDRIIAKGAEQGVSDIHIEPREEFVRLRFRVDGLLVEQEKLPKSMQASLISSAKIMADLDIAESRVPQDGRFGIKLGKKNFDIRASTLLTVHGEKVVLRMLERGRTGLTLSDLGFSEEGLSLYRKIAFRKNGMVLITGPTGSGKTTTLYATLKEFDQKGKNIITIEDPVEYKLPGINQVQVNYKAGLTFPRVLKAVLRQDPDIILVGEIRDLETARIAVQAALTGHLILSTLHTKDAPSAYTRLVELGIEDYLVRDVLLGVVAQRLVKVKPSGRIGVFEIWRPGEQNTTLREETERLIREGTVEKEEMQKALELD